MRSFRPALSLLLLAGACWVALDASGAAKSKGPKGPKGSDAPDGGALFQSSKCIMCHGQDGKGFAAIHTPDFTDPKWQARNTDEEIFSTIKSGKPNTAMKAFGDKLKDDEIQALVKYIRSLNSAKK